MPKKAQDKAARMTAAALCSTMYHLSEVIQFGLLQVAHINSATGKGVGNGLTAQERDVVMKLSERYKDNGRLCLKLHNRFEGR